MFIRPSLSIFLSFTLSTWALAQQKPDISGSIHGTKGPADGTQGSTHRIGHSDSVVLSLIEGSGSPLIGPDHPGSSGNKNGFEGGVAFVQGDSFHLFVTEEPHQWVRTRTGHWTSRDGRQWQRVATIQQSADDPQDPRYAIWSPMPVYNEHEGRWDLFYVGYETSGTVNGRVFRAVSEKKGLGGLGGHTRICRVRSFHSRMLRRTIGRVSRELILSFPFA